MIIVHFVDGIQWKMYPILNFENFTTVCKNKYTPNGLKSKVLSEKKLNIKQFRPKLNECENFKDTIQKCSKKNWHNSYFWLTMIWKLHIYTFILILIHFNTAIAQNKKVCEETVKSLCVIPFFTRNSSKNPGYYFYKKEIV